MKDIKEILDRFYKGETTLEEESKLRELINNNQLRITEEKGTLPSELFLEKQLFDFYESEKEIELGDDFDEKLFDKISEKKVVKLNTKVKSLIYRVSGIAAVLLVAIGFYLIFNFKENQSKELTNEDKKTIEYTLDALTMMSDYINLANEHIGKLSIIEESFEKIHNATNIEEYNDYIFNILGEES